MPMVPPTVTEPEVLDSVRSPLLAEAVMYFPASESLLIVEVRSLSDVKVLLPALALPAT